MSVPRPQLIFGTLALLILGNGAASAESEIHLNPLIRRHIDGQSRLERSRYFNLAANSPNFWKRCPMGEAGYLLDELHISLGRGIGLGASAIKSGAPITEDPERSGYADPKSVERHFANLPVEDAELRERFGANMDLIVHDNDKPHPEFMGSAYRDADHYQRISANPVAAGEFIAACLKHGFNEFTRPRFYEPLNEPSWQIMQTPQFAALHVETARAVRRMGLNVKVGGPCAPVGYLYNSDYRGQWTKIFKPFIDAAGDVVDFLSFHIYDYYTGSSAEILTGLPLENAFDLLEAYSLRRFGKVKPFACSEHGATGANFNLANVPEKKNTKGFKGVEVPRERLEWLHINSINGQVMSFMERPGMILKTAPFILDRTDAWNPRYVYSLYSRKNFEKGGEWRRTGLLAFYELWRNVRGERVEARCLDPDLQVSAFVEGAQCFLCVKNLSDEPKELRVHSQSALGRGQRDRCYWREEGLVFEKNEALELGRSLRLEPQEMTVVYLEAEGGFPHAGNVFERRFFAVEQTAPIVKDEPLVARIAVPGKGRYVCLRIGISRSQQAERTPKVWFNGAPQKVPMERAAEVRATSSEYVTTKLVWLDAALLREENEVRIQFPDSGGAIGAVCLQVGFEQEPRGQ